MAFEADELEVLGGVRHGRTMGSPVSVVIRNTEWPKWVDAMDPEPRDDLDAIRDTGRGQRLTRPRPGHADLTAALKYGYDDVRDALERASARETAARVVVGTLAKQLLAEVGITVVSHVVNIGGETTGPDAARPGPDDLATVDASDVRCFDADAEARMIARIDAAHADNDTLGGVIEVIAYGLPPGLGSHVHWDRKLDTRLAAACLSVQAMKGVEFGDGFALATGPAARPTTRSSTTRRHRLRPALRPRRRARGRHVHRPAAAAAGRDEAHLVAAAAAQDRRPRHPRTGAGHHPALRRLRRPACRRRARIGRRLRARRRAAREDRRGHRHRGPPQPRRLPRRDRPAMMSRNLALLGMMGAGKTTVARELGDRLGRRVVDTDDEIRRWTGRSIPELFADHGEAGFRDLERQVIEELSRFHDLVIALGGGAVLRDDNVASLLLTGVLVELRATPEVLIERLIGESDDRPLLGSPEELAARVRAVHAERADRYAEVADLTVDAERTPDLIVHDILEWAMAQGDVLTPSEHEQVMTT
jgi:shikimate kinase